jgi:TetR/AcrR family transcriptional regulator, regulator of cefoperazone and chloramphenicol sensitivity
MRKVNEKRKYESEQRAVQALWTRAEILHAARRLFVTKGWAATTVRDVATTAGVSVPTVYATYGGKSGLAWSLVDSAMLTTALPRERDELEAAATPADQLAVMVSFDRTLFERAGDVIVLAREAGRTEPELADAYKDGRSAGDEVRDQVFRSWPEGTLRTDVPTAIDVYAALCNVDVYTTLTTERGWPPNRVERWWHDVLVRELLA